MGNLSPRCSFLCAPSFVMQDTSIGRLYHQTLDAVLCRSPQGKAGSLRHPHLKLSSMLKRPARSWCTREALKSRHPMDSCVEHGKLSAHVMHVSGLSQCWIQSAQECQVVLRAAHVLLAALLGSEVVVQGVAVLQRRKHSHIVSPAYHSMGFLRLQVAVAEQIVPDLGGGHVHYNVATACASNKKVRQSRHGVGISASLRVGSIRRKSSTG